MNICPVSFGKKHYIMPCQIQDREQKKFVPASLVQYDCEDTSDVDEMLHGAIKWQFRHAVACQMFHVNNTKDIQTPSYSFFAIENQNKEIVSVAQVKKFGQDLILDILESEPNKKYKYCGSTMMSFLRYYALKNNFKRIYIPNPVDNAKDFYVKKCGFREIKNSTALELTRHNFKKPVYA
jgi:hypothetical protein